MKFSANIDFKKIYSLIFFATLFLLICAFGVRFNVLDVDIWARIINGGFVVHGFKPLYNDIFSFAPTHTWYDPEWLSSAGLYLVQKYFGPVGIVFLKCLLCFLILFSTIFVTRKLNPDLKVNNIPFFVLFSLILLQFGYLFFSTRCQLYAFIIFVFWLYFLEKIRNNENKYFFFLPLIMILWQNIHGGCIAGIGLLFIYLIGEFLNGKLVKKYLLLLMCLVLFFAINPWGVEYYKFIFDSIFVDRSYISEWRPPFEVFKLYKNSYFYFLFILFSSSAFQIIKNRINYKNFDKTRFLLICTVLFLSITCSKHVALALVLLTIFLYKDFENTLLFLSDKLKINKLLSTIANAILISTIFIASTFILIVTPCFESYKKQFATVYPGHMLEFLRINNIKGKILTSFHQGSFIAYKYFPDLKIYMDGRQEQVYSKKISDDLINFLDRKGKNPDYILETYKPDIVLLYRYEFANSDMEKNKDYFLISRSKYYSLYVLNKYKRKNYKQITKTNEEFFDTLFDTNIDFSKRVYE